jgi:hypothetical protein
VAAKITLLLRVKLDRLPSFVSRKKNKKPAFAGLSTFRWMPGSSPGMTNGEDDSLLPPRIYATSLRQNPSGPSASHPARTG